MCGIVGFNFISNNNNIYNVTKHRGPDNTESKVINNFTLGHNRLSIVDHDINSNQPLTSKCGRYTIVFNGEVYNHKELRHSLSNKYNFKTKSDTEVILYSYIEYGEKCLNKFIGMFSFAIYDEFKEKLFCARDRVGIKPFLYYFDNGKFIFGSEINIILEVLKKTPQVNLESIRQFIKYLYIPAPNTIFEKINKLSPGCFLVYENNHINIKKYWKIENHIGKNYNLDENEILNKLDNLLNDSIKTRMIADVNLGSFLSGGIDSSLILYYMQKNSLKKINTYTIGFKDLKNFDETFDAKIMSNFYNTNHTEIFINSDIIKLLPIMVSHFGEPFASPTSLLIYELTKESKNYATVALAGDGGDEIFSGYPKHKALMYANKLNFIPKSFFKPISYLINNIPENIDGNHFIRRLKKFIFSLGKKPNYLYDDWSSYITDSDLNKLFRKNLSYNHVVNDLWINQNHNDFLLKSSIVDLKTYLPNDMLYYGDIMSMANSFEVRYPLLDHRIIEFMTGINSKYRIRNGQTKYLLKKLLSGKIPNEIINKKKMGLNPPIGIWLNKELKYIINDYLSEESIKKRGLFDYNYVKNLIDEFKSKTKDRSLNLWSMIVLEEWFRQYID